MPLKVCCSAIIETPTLAGAETGIVLVSELDENGEIDCMNLPGGGPKKKESLSDCVVREVMEETGLDIRPSAIVGIYDNLRTRAGNRLVRIVFSGDIVGGYLQQSDKHPLVRSYAENEIGILKKREMLQKNAASRAIKDYYQGARYPLELVSTKR